MPALTEQQLADDLTRAMKAREMPRVYVLRGLLTAAKHLKVERKGAALAEADLVQLVRREIRKREEAEEFAVKAGRGELIEQNRAERALLEVYVPALLGPAITAAVLVVGLGIVVGRASVDGRLSSTDARVLEDIGGLVVVFLAGFYDDHQRGLLGCSHLREWRSGKKDGAFRRELRPRWKGAGDQACHSAHPAADREWRAFATSSSAAVGDHAAGGVLPRLRARRHRARVAVS